MNSLKVKRNHKAMGQHEALYLSKKLLKPKHHPTSIEEHQLKQSAKR